MSDELFAVMYILKMKIAQLTVEWPLMFKATVFDALQQNASYWPLADLIAPIHSDPRISVLSLSLSFVLICFYSLKNNILNHSFVMQNLLTIYEKFMVQPIY